MVGLIEPLNCMDVWGATVLQAADLQRQAGVGVILVSSRIYERAKEDFRFSEFPSTRMVGALSPVTDPSASQEEEGSPKSGRSGGKTFILEGYKTKGGTK